MGDAASVAEGIEDTGIKKLAKDAGLDLYDKLSDPPIPCFSGTVDQLRRFAELVIAEGPRCLRHDRETDRT